MKIQSLGHRTKFIFNRFDGSVEDRGDYFVVTTKSNPNYFWGNLLVYKNPPKAGDFHKWKADFSRELTNPAIYHMTFAWDSPDGDAGETSDFIADGFELDRTVVLTAQKVLKPPKYNEDITVKTIQGDEEFEQVIQIQTECGGEELSKSSWEKFYRTQLKQYRKMINSGLGQWFGAWIDNELVGSLGIFTDENIGRYQIVSTAPTHQRKGVCSTLVYESALFAFDRMNVETLVMIADEEYHAAKIYESVGFEPAERLVGLCKWYKKKV